MWVRFGECELSLDRRELRREGEPVAIEPQVFDVLAYLLSRRERVVRKVELLDEVWGDRFVSDSALTSRIKTARGRGYRFVAYIDTAAEADARTRGNALLAAVAAAARGAGGAIEVEGGAGAGKTDLLDQAADDALA